MTDNGLTCREVLDLLTEYLEGALAPVEHARVAAHLEECDGVRPLPEQFDLDDRSDRERCARTPYPTTFVSRCSPHSGRGAGRRVTPRLKAAASHRCASSSRL